MGNEDGTDIEQLWFTWSDIGIDTIRVGYRIRAASPRLSNLNSVQAQQLGRYQLYELPKGAEATISSNDASAPVSLAFITNDGAERILVHKVYSGRDRVGRDGIFFVHLLTNLPHEFSPLDAISLWNSPFWRTFDDMGQANRHSTKLDPLSLDDLRGREQNGRASDSQLDRKIGKFLPYVIEAYLSKNLLLERAGEERKDKQVERQQLYIAGLDTLVANLISGLIHTLAPQLVQDLTFSTYENAVSKATTEIVGTCWLSQEEQLPNSAVEQLIPVQYYQTKLAINCYTGACTQLKGHPLVSPHPLVARFAKDATRYFLANEPANSDFAKLLSAARRRRYLTISAFLDLYERLVLREKRATRADVEVALRLRSPQDYEHAVESFSYDDYQQKLVELIITVPGWWEKYKASVINFSNHRAELPSLDLTFRTLSEDYALPEIMEIAQEEAARLGTLQMLEYVKTDVTTKISILIDFISCITPPKTYSDIWLSLLQNLRSIEHISRFFFLYWNAYLLETWLGLLSASPKNRELLYPLLVVSWEQMGTFLALNLPLEWRDIVYNSALDCLIYKLPVPPPRPEIVAGLEQNSHFQIQDVLQHLAQVKGYQQTAIGFFGALVQGGYRTKLQLLDLLFSSPIGENENAARGAVGYAQLTPPEQASFLEQYGTKYLSNKKMTSTLITIFVEIVQSQFQQEKMRVLFIWLASPELTPWLSSPSARGILNFSDALKGTTNFSKILNAADLDPQQGGDFLLQLGPKYVPLYPNSPTLLSLFGNYVQYGTPTAQQRMNILWTWLHSDLQLDVLEEVLPIAGLSSGERRDVLLEYGSHYLSLYPQSPTLRGYVNEFLDYLRTAPLTLFRTSSPAGEPSTVAKLLASLSEQNPSSDLFRNWSIAAQFVGNPSLLTQDWQYTVKAIDWLLASNVVQEPTSADLLKELARACLPNKQNGLHEENVAALVLNVRDTFLSPQNKVTFLLRVAQEAREWNEQKHYEQMLLEPYALLERCALIVFLSQGIFPQGLENERAQWVKGCLDSLASNDKKAIEYLNERASKWPRLFQEQWQWYLSLYPSSATPSLVERAKHFLTGSVPNNTLSPSESGKEYPAGLLDQASARAALQLATAPPTVSRFSRLTTTYRKHRASILVAAALLLLVGMLVAYTTLASAEVTLTVTSHVYTHSVDLTASTDQKAGAVLAMPITKEFSKQGNGHATGKTQITNAKSRGSVCFISAGNTVNIPTSTIVATSKNIQFVTTANGVSHTTCENDQASIPIQAVQGGESGNVQAGIISTILPESLNAIAQQNNVKTDALKLTVSNAKPTDGGGTQTVPAITEIDRTNAKVDLSNQLKKEIAAWAKGLSKDGIAGDLTTKVDLVNTEAKGTAIEDGDTFAATVNVTATVLYVRTADVQKAALPQLRTAMGKDKDYADYVIADNIKSPVSIKQPQIKNSDEKSLHITFDASAVARAVISDETVQNAARGRSVDEAQDLIKSAVPGTQKVNIQVKPGFFPWFVPLWSNHIKVNILPNLDPDGHLIANKS